MLTRAVRILEVFSPEEPALPVTEIARRARGCTSPPPRG
ncbi:helix-turn-helix domain-containing protein [Geodermatophilus sp. SYSU D00815]